MKHFPIPQPITLVDIATGKRGDVVPFAIIAHGWLNDPRAATNVVELARLLKVVEQFMKPPGEIASIEDADQVRLLPIVHEIPKGVAPMVAMQLLPFSNAVLGATDEMPTKESTT